MAFGPLRRAAVRHGRDALVAPRSSCSSSCRSTSTTSVRALLLLIGLAMGLFASPNQTGIMNSLPPNQRGVGAGMSATFQNSAMVLSIGVFFSLMMVGLSSSLPSTLQHGLSRRASPRRREPSRTCRRSASCSRRSSATTRCGSCSARCCTTCRRRTRRTSPAASSSRASCRGRSRGACARRSTSRSPPACRGGGSWLRGGRYVHDTEPHVIPAESLDGELALPAEGD